MKKIGLFFIFLAAIFVMAGCAQKVEHEVIFRAGVEELSKVKVVDGKLIDEVPEAPEREGYTFAGWEVGPELPFDVAKDPVKDSLVLQAVYQIKEYEIVFKAEGEEDVKIQAKHFSKIDLSQHEIKEKEGYNSFWQVDGEVDEDGKPKAFDNREIVEPLTLNAVYQIKVFKVEFDLVGGTLDPKPEEQKVDWGQVASKPEGNPTKEHYTFKHWAVDGVEFDFATPIEADTTIKAVYEGDQYTLKFMVGDVQFGETVDVRHGDLVVNPEVLPTKEGFVFVGWLLDDQDYDMKAEITGNLVLVAKFVEAFKLTLPTEVTSDQEDNEVIANGTEVVLTINVPEGQTLSAILVNGVDKIADVTENTLTITITANTMVEVTFA